MSSEPRGPKAPVRFDRVRLRAARLALKWTQEDLAEAAGVHVDGGVRRAERGIPVALETALSIAGALGVPSYTDLLAAAAPDPAARAADETVQMIFGGVPRMPPRMADFTGRDDELSRLHSVLTSGKPAAITQALRPSSTPLARFAVHGLGGVGKTMLAVEYVHRFRDFYDGVWWCSAEDSTSLLVSLARLAAELGATAEEESDINKAGRAALRRLDERRANFLLVYDNVVTPDEVTDLLPTGGVRLLVTSRFSDWGAWAEEVALDVLPLADAVAYLTKRAGRQDDAGAAALAVTLGCLPLALDHAAAYCKRTSMPFTEYASKAKRLIAVPLIGVNYPRSVDATFKMAIEEVVRRCAPAEMLMNYLAQCAAEPIPLGLLEGAIPEEEERKAAIVALTDFSLAKRDRFDDGTLAVTVHRLVQLVARTRAETSGKAAAAAEQIAEQMRAIYPSDGYEKPASWALCEQLTPHLLAYCDVDANERLRGLGQANLLNDASSYYSGRGIYPLARRLSERSLSIVEKWLGPENSYTAKALTNLGHRLHAEGDLTAARSAYERAVAIFEKSCGLRHLDTATALDNLARVLCDQGAIAAAQPLCERALAVRRRRLGSEHPDTIVSLVNLSALLHGLGDLTAARSLNEHVVAIRERQLGPEHQDTALSLNNLATVLCDQGDYIAARPLCERALAIRARQLGPEHPDTLTTYNNLAMIVRRLGDLATARSLLEKILPISEGALGQEHLDTASVLNNLGTVIYEQGDIARAKPLYERALAIRQKLLGAKHSLTWAVRENLAHFEDQ